jgi:phosphate-selective porin OprO and OprP
MKRPLLLIITLLLLTKVSYSQTTNDILNLLIEQKLVSQEKADSLRADAALKQQDADAKKKSFPVTSSKALQLGGVTQIRYQNIEGSGKISGFDVRRARLEAQGKFSPYFGYRLLTEFAGASAKALDAYVDVKLADYFNLTIGQQKIAFSLENQTSDSKLDFIERSQVVDKLVARTNDVIGNQNGRDLGIQANGSLLKLNSWVLIDYQVGYYNGSGINVTDNNKAKDVAARIVLHPIAGLDLGGSYYDGVDYFTPTGSKVAENRGRTRWGAELSYEWYALSVKSEYIKGKDADNKLEGYYVQAGYYVLPQKIQAAIKYDNLDPNIGNPGDITNWYIIGLNYYFSSNTKLQVSYNFKKGQDGAYTNINNNLAAAQFQITF